jgi:hypothetical protein
MADVTKSEQENPIIEVVEDIMGSKNMTPVRLEPTAEEKLIFGHSVQHTLQRIADQKERQADNAEKRRDSLHGTRRALSAGR